MRTYGRITTTTIVDGVEVKTKSWTVAQTDAQGNNDLVWLTTLIQVLLLNLGESPFYANYGIPAQQSVLQQTFPDYYVTLTQQTFSAYFASLIIGRINSDFPPTYQVAATTHAGVILPAQVAV